MFDGIIDVYLIDGVEGLDFCPIELSKKQIRQSYPICLGT